MLIFVKATISNGMKKQKKRILDALKKKFEGVSEKVLDKIADKLAEKAKDEDTADKAVEETTFQNILESESDRRANEASVSAVANYEEKHSLKDGQKITQEPQPGTGKGTEPTDQETGTDGNVKSDDNQNQMLEAIQSLKNEVASLKQGNVAKSRNERLTKAIDGASDVFQRTINSSYEHMSFEDEAEFDKWVDNVEKDAQEDAKQSSSKRAVFGRPMSGGKSDDEEVPESITRAFKKGDDDDGQPF